MALSVKAPYDPVEVMYGCIEQRSRVSKRVRVFYLERMEDREFMK